MSFLDKPSKEWFVEASVFAMIAKVYDKRDLIANAEYFKQRAIYSLAQALLAAWFEMSDERLK